MDSGNSMPLSDDHLYQWNGSEWKRAPEIVFECPACAETSSVRSDKKTARCKSRHDFDFVQCLYCNRILLRAKEHRDYATRCPTCGAVTRVPRGVPAWEWARDEHTRGSWPPGREAIGRRLVEGLTLVGARGTALLVGLSGYAVDFNDPIVRVTSSSGAAEEIAYATVISLTVTPGQQRRDHREVGRDLLGGGLIGAAVSAANRQVLTSSVLRLTTRSSEYVFESARHTPGALNQLLEPVLLRMVSASTSSSPDPAGPPLLPGGSGAMVIPNTPPPLPPPPAEQPAVQERDATSIPPTSLADELAKLGKLRDDGLLTPVEFETIKSRLLA